MSSLRRMSAYMAPYTWAVILGLLTVILPVAMELLVPRLLQLVIDQGIRQQDMAAIARYSGIMFASALIGSLATLGQGVCRAQISQGVAYDMRNDLFRHIQALSWPDLDRLQTGQLMTRISSDVNVIRMFASAGLALLIRALLMVIGSVILMMTIDLRLSAVVLVILALSALLIAGVMRSARPIFTRVQQRLARLNTIVQENLAGVRVVKAYVREPYEIAQFGDSNAALMAENITVGRLMAVVMPGLMILTGLGTVVVLWWGGLDTAGGRLSVGELVAFNNYLMIGMTPLMMLGNLLMMVSRAEASAERVLEVLATAPSVHDPAAPHRAATVAGRVEFEHVSFRYDGGETPAAAPVSSNGDRPVRGRGHQQVLHDVSFTVAPGQRLALLGATGSGKSSLIHLLPRFYDVEAGAIRIDGVDVRAWAAGDLRARIGLVLQEATLFRGTVRANIAYGNPDAPLEDVIAAARAAEAHDFIMAMADGYDSPVEARGANLSGGQKQRIAIARALLVDPAILVLDDCTSAVDMETEFRIQAALDELMEDRTTIIVAQRISSVLGADQILVLDEGRVAASGTHRELLERSPIYQEIVASQIGVDHEELRNL